MPTGGHRGKKNESAEPQEARAGATRPAARCGKSFTFNSGDPSEGRAAAPTADHRGHRHVHELLGSGQKEARTNRNRLRGEGRARTTQTRRPPPREPTEPGRTQTGTRNATKPRTAAKKPPKPPWRPKSAVSKKGLETAPNPATQGPAMETAADLDHNL